MPIWLTKFLHVLQVIWEWLKGNWLVLVIGIALIASILMAWNKGNSYTKLLKQFQDQMLANQKSMDDLRKVQQDQIVKQQELNRKYEEVLEKVEKDYQDQLHLLTAESKAKLKDIIALNHDDPNLMAHEINQLFGIPIYTVGLP